MPPRKRTKATEPVAEAVPVRMPAQGTGGIKRTPQSAFAPAKDKDVYEVAKIMFEDVPHVVVLLNSKTITWAAIIE